MTPDDKDLHQDIGSLKEFKEWAKGEFDRLHVKIDDAMAFKWKVVGASGVVALIVSAIASAWKNNG